VTVAARQVNGALLVALLLAVATGILAEATGTGAGRVAVVAHGVAALAVVVLVPWKVRVARAALRYRKVPSRVLSYLLTVLTLATLATGVAHTTGLVRSAGGLLTMWLHVAGALALIPLAVWHVVARPAQLRRTDLSRRTLLRAATVTAAAGALYGSLFAVTELARLPGRRRRFTGSYETGSLRPAAMPGTIWLDDTVPDVDPQPWRLTVVDGTGRRELSLSELGRSELGAGTSWRALLDCTSGWYAEQDWAGVPVAALVTPSASARSVVVRSVTGYARRFPLRDLPRLLLATRVGGAPLARRHGYPLRLVAPGRRGFWWVKWVDRIELSDRPWWWQPPFPLS